jgi:hypothetical protein
MMIKSKGEELHVNDDNCTHNFDQKSCKADYSEYPRLEEDDITIRPSRTGCEGVDWIYMIHARVQWYKVP